MIAEDASIYSGMTKPVEWNGFGFDLKWSLGWMNDSLKFMKKDPIHRKYHMDDLLKSFGYMDQERYLLSLSHDEVVHGKKSLFSKMPLDSWKQFAQSRLYYASAMTHPGKKLFFMGSELAQVDEWHEGEEIHWHLLQNPRHREFHHFVKSMNRLYLENPALFEWDYHRKGFAWIDHRDYNHCVISYMRKSASSTLVCVQNYTDSFHGEYVVYLPNVREIVEVMNTDDLAYGGSGKVNHSPMILSDKSGFCITMPPLAAMIFEVEFDERSHI